MNFVRISSLLCLLISAMLSAGCGSNSTDGRISGNDPGGNTGGGETPTLEECLTNPAPECLNIITDVLACLTDPTPECLTGVLPELPELPIDIDCITDPTGEGCPELPVDLGCLTDPSGPNCPQLPEELDCLLTPADPACQQLPLAFAPSDFAKSASTEAALTQEDKASALMYILAILFQQGDAIDQGLADALTVAIIALVHDQNLAVAFAGISNFLSMPDNQALLNLVLNPVINAISNDPAELAAEIEALWQAL